MSRVARASKTSGEIGYCSSADTVMQAGICSVSRQPTCFLPIKILYLSVSLEMTPSSPYIHTNSLSSQDKKKGSNKKKHKTSRFSNRVSRNTAHKNSRRDPRMRILFDIYRINETENLFWKEVGYETYNMTTNTTSLVDDGIASSFLSNNGTMNFDDFVGRGGGGGRNNLDDMIDYMDEWCTNSPSMSPESLADCVLYKVSLLLW